MYCETERKGSGKDLQSRLYIDDSQSKETTRVCAMIAYVNARTLSYSTINHRL